MTSFLMTSTLSKIGKTKQDYFFLHFFLLFISFTISAQQDSATLQAVVIQATRTSSDSPVPHTNIKAAAIAQQQQAQDIPYLLSGIPSLVETSDAGAGVGYTGLRIRGSDPTRVNVTLNGVPFNDAESQGVFWVNMPDLASSAAEIQVQRGVGTSTNGAGAFGATVNIDLTKVARDPFAQITNTFGAFGVRKHAIQVGTGALAGGKISFSGRLSTVHSDGYIDRATANLRALHLTGTYIDDHQSLQMHFLGGREITYQAWYGLPAQYYDAGTNSTYNVAGTERTDQPHPNEVDNYNQQHYLLHYKRNISSRLLVQLNGHYTRGFGYYEQYKANQAFIDYNLNNIPFADTTITSTDLIRRRWLDNHFYGTTWVVKYANGKTHLTFGGAANQYRGKHFGEVIWATYNPAPLGHRYYENDAVKNDVNAYFQIETKYSSHFSSFVDLQLRHVGYQFLGFNNELQNVDQTANLLFFNPKAGLNYRFSSRSDAYIFTGIGHREPNRDDFTQSTPNSRPKAEQLFNVETGVKTRQTNWSLSANLFGMYYRNQLVLSGRINDVGAYARANVPTSYRTGLELEATARPISRLLFSGNISWSTNKASNFVEYRDNWTTGTQEAITYPKSDLAFSPNLIARAEVNYDIIPVNKKHALGITLSGKHVGRQFLDNTSNTYTQLPAFRFMDARLNCNLSLRHQQKIRFIMAVNNLFNAKYASNGWVYRFTSPDYDPRSVDFYTRQEGNGGIYHQAGYFPQAGTNWMMTVVVEF